MKTAATALDVTINTPSEASGIDVVVLAVDSKEVEAEATQTDCQDGGASLPRSEDGDAKPANVGQRCFPQVFAKTKKQAENMLVFWAPRRYRPRRLLLNQGEARDENGCAMSRMIWRVGESRRQRGRPTGQRARR